MLKGATIPPPPIAPSDGDYTASSEKEESSKWAPSDSFATPFNKGANFFNRFLNTGLKRPLHVDDFTREANSIARMDMEAFEGLRAEYSRCLSPNFQIGHFIHLADPRAEASYNFVACYATEKIFLNARWFTNALVLGRLKYTPFKPLSLSINLRHGGPNKRAPFLSDASLEFLGPDFIASLQYDPKQDAVQATYCQSISPRLSLGLGTGYSMTYDQGVYTVAGRYEVPEDSIYAGILSSQGILQLCYTKKVAKNTSLSAIWNWEGTQEGMLGTTSIGYEYKMRFNSVRGSIDTRGRVISILEDRSSNVQAITFCGMFDYFNESYSFGVDFAWNL